MHYMHYKDYIHHDFYVYSPVLLTQYRGHCWHTPCTELYILRISAWLLRKPPLPCHRGGGEPSGWGGVCGGPCSYIHPPVHGRMAHGKSQFSQRSSIKKSMGDFRISITAEMNSEIARRCKVKKKTSIIYIYIWLVVTGTMEFG